MSHPPRLVVPQGLDDGSLAAVELKTVQFIQPLVRSGERQPAVGHGDRHRRRGAARDQFGAQRGQPLQRLIRDFVPLEQLSDISNMIGEFPRHGDHGYALYPAADSRNEMSASRGRVSASGPGNSQLGRTACAGPALKSRAGPGQVSSLRHRDQPVFSPGLQPAGNSRVDVLM